MKQEFDQVPKSGESFRCESCGMQIRLEADCHCEGGNAPLFECCGKTLTPC